MEIKDLEYQEVFCLSREEEASSQINGGITVDALAAIVGIAEDFVSVYSETQAFAFSFNVA